MVNYALHSNFVSFERILGANFVYALAYNIHERNAVHIRSCDVLQLVSIRAIHRCL